MDYSANNAALWGFIVQIGLIAASILAAYFLYRKVNFIRQMMMPVAVLAGFLLLILKYLGVPLRSDILEMLVFHGIALGFIAMSLRVPPEKAKGNARLTALKSGAVIVSTYLVQGSVGLLISLILSATLSPGLFHAAGMLLPMGYGQGPGQANNVGSTYETLGFAGGRSFGLSLAAAGYLVACIAGVIILNVLKHRGRLSEPLKGSKGQLARDFFEGNDEMSVSSSVDALSLQAALVFIVYLVTFLITWGITSAIGAAAPGAAKTISPLIWGFNFIFGSAIAILARVVLTRFRKNRSYAAQHQNNYLLNRISGCFFDIMIVAGIASIDLKDIRGLWLPFILMAATGGVVTWFHLCRVCRAVYPDYYYQGLISMFGMLTGTISSGVLLLREIDPELSTPAANNLITGSSFGIIFGAPILILVSLAARSRLLCCVVLAIVLVYLCLMCLLIFGIPRKKKPGAV